MLAERQSKMRLAAAVLLAALAGTTGGQSRHERGVSSLRPVGWGPSARHADRLNTYYTGLSDLNLHTESAGGGALGSSVYTGSSMAIHRSSGGAAPPGALAYGTPGALGASEVNRQYAPAPRIPTLAASAAPRGSMAGAVPMAASAWADYLQEKQARREDMREKVVMSLVPTEPGEYRDAMLAGEDAFRKGQYKEAAEHFKAARRLSKDSPASLLSAARAAFATPAGSYDTAAQLLCRLLARFPDLALARVAPRAAYGKESDLREHVAKLESHTKAHPADAAAQLVLGYIRWRQGRGAEAREALAAAQGHATDGALRIGIQSLSKSIAAAEKFAQQELPDMAAPLEYPHAGIRLALPAGFELRPAGVRGQILNTSRPAEGRATIAITLDTRVVGEGVTPRSFWDFALGHWQRGGAADMRLLEERDVQVGGVDAVARLLTYSSGRHQAAAVGACFIRQVKRPAAEPLWIAYLLLLKGSADRMTAMFPMINGIAKSITLSEIRRPIDMPVELTDTAVRDPLGRYALRLPKGWSFAQVKAGPVLGQVDLLLGGAASPRVRAMVTDMPKSMDAKACGLDVIAFVREQKGHKVDILSQGAAKVGGKDGYQFILRTQVPLGAGNAGAGGKSGPAGKTKLSDPFIQGVRLFGVPGEKGRREYLLMVLDCNDAPAAKAEGVMNKLSAGVTFLGWRHLIASPQAE